MNFGNQCLSPYMGRISSPAAGKAARRAQADWVSRMLTPLIQSKEDTSDQKSGTRSSIWVKAFFVPALFVTCLQHSICSLSATESWLRDVSGEYNDEHTGS